MSKKDHRKKKLRNSNSENPSSSSISSNAVVTTEQTVSKKSQKLKSLADNINDKGVSRSEKEVKVIYT